MARLTATETLSLEAKLKRLSNDAVQWAAEARQKAQEADELRAVVKALRAKIARLEAAQASEDA